MFVVAVAVCSVVGSIYRGCKKVRIFTVTQGPLSVVTPGNVWTRSWESAFLLLLLCMCLYLSGVVGVRFNSVELYIQTHHNLNLPRIPKLICCEDNYISSFLKILLSQSFEAIFLCSFIAQITLNNQARAVNYFSCALWDYYVIMLLCKQLTKQTQQLVINSRSLEPLLLICQQTIQLMIR